MGVVDVSPRMALLEQAFDNVTNGYEVFPVDARTKRPVTENGFYDATTDGDTIFGWFASDPVGWAVGVRTGELVVLDVDMKDGVNGYKALNDAMLVMTNDNYQTASGGTHALYRAGGEILNNSQNYDSMVGVDRRAHGGYIRLPAGVVLPPVETLTLVPEWFSKVTSAPVAGVYEGSVQEWMDAFSAPVDGLLRRILADAAVGEIGHGRLLSIQADIVINAGKGHMGAGTAMAEFRDIYLDGFPDYAHQFDAALAGAVLKYGTTPEQNIAENEGDLPEIDVNPIRVLSLSDLRSRPTPQWWVQGLFQQSTVAVLAGRGGIGKSFVMLDICARIASGVPEFFGQKVKQGRVMYVAAEGAETFITRIAAWETENSTKLDESRFGLIEDGVNMSSEESVANLIERVIEHESDFIVLDTFSQLSNVDNENDASQTAAVMKAALRLRKARPNATVVFVHHAGKATGKFRGSSAIRDNVDTLISVSYHSKDSTSGPFRISTDTELDGKQRNATPLTLKGFTLRDSEGHDSAVLVRERMVSNTMQTIENVLADGAPHGMADFVAGWIPESDDLEDTDPEALRKRFSRLLTNLSDAGKVTKSGAARATVYQLN